MQPDYPGQRCQNRNGNTIYETELFIYLSQSGHLNPSSMGQTLYIYRRDKCSYISYLKESGKSDR